MRRCLVLMGLLAVPSPAAPQTALPTERAEPGIFFVVPEGWERLPDEIIWAFREREEATGIESLANTYFAAGLQGPEGEEWLDLPYLLIRVDPTIQTSSKLLREELTKTGGFEFSAEDERRVREHDIAREFEFGVPQWDETMDGAFTVASMTTGEGAEVFIFQVSRALPGGLVHAYYYDRAGTDPAPVHAFMRSFMAQLSWPGDPTRRTASPWLSNAIEKGLVGLVVGGLFGLFRGILSHRKETPTES